MPPRTPHKLRTLTGELVPPSPPLEFTQDAVDALIAAHEEATLQDAVRELEEYFR